MGLGSYPGVKLAEARDKAREAATLRAKGLDPLGEAQKAKASLPTSQTFSQAASAYLDHLTAQRANTKFPGGTLKQWRSTLRRFALPKIGAIDVREIKHSHIAGILAPMTLVKETNKGKGMGGPMVAAQLRPRIERVLDFAAAHGFRDPDAPNPARPELLIRIGTGARNDSITPRRRLWKRRNYSSAFATPKARSIAPPNS